MAAADSQEVPRNASSLGSGAVITSLAPVGILTGSPGIEEIQQRFERAYAPPRQRPHDVGSQSRPEPVADAPGFDLKPDPLTAQTPAELMQTVRAFRIWHGEPSFRIIAHRASPPCSHSTLFTAYRSDKLPRFEQLMAIITGCGGDQDDQERFATAWRRIRLGHTDDPSPGLRLVPPAPGV